MRSAAQVAWTATGLVGAVEPLAEVKESIHAVLYVSRCDPPIVREALDSLVLDARAANRRDGLTGALLHTHRHFAQYLEGGRVALDVLMGKIRQDKRHRDLIIVRSRQVDDRSFAKWSMAYSGSSNYAEKQVADAAAQAEYGARDQAAEKLLWMMREFIEERP